MNPQHFHLFMCLYFISTETTSTMTGLQWYKNLHCLLTSFKKNFFYLNDFCAFIQENLHGHIYMYLFWGNQLESTINHKLVRKFQRNSVKPSLPKSYLGFYTRGMLLEVGIGFCELQYQQLRCIFNQIKINLGKNLLIISNNGYEFCLWKIIFLKYVSLS